MMRAFIMPNTFYSRTIHTLIILLSTALLLDTSYADSSTQEYFIISSGSLGGNYNEAGNVISELLNGIRPEYSVFKVITSNGSEENIKRIKDRFSDFAIVQRDVFISNYYGDGDKIKNVSVISPLFQEKFIIYTLRNSNIEFNEFKEHVNSSPTAIRIGLTSLDGTSYKTFSKIASLLGLDVDNITFIVGNYTELLHKYNSKKIDYILTFSLPLKDLDKANKVYFNDADIKLLTGRMRYLSAASLDNNRHRTLGVWALFIGLNSSINQIGEDAIIQSLLSPELTDSPVGRLINNTFNEFKSSSSLFSHNLKGLPVIDSYQKAMNRNRSRAGMYLAVILSITIIASLLWVSLFRHYQRRHWKYLWIRYKYILIGLLLVAIFYLLCMEWLILSEKSFFKENGIKSSILDMARSDIQLWNLVRIFANNDGGVFPISVAGKLTTSLSTYIILIGGISIAVVEYFMYKLIAKRREGLMKVKYEEHIIIAGWSDNTPNLIEELLFACEEYHKRKLMIVCVVADPKSVLENYDYISDLEYRKEIVLVKGYIRNKNTLEQCNAHLAKIIIILAEETGVHADEKTLMRALSIRKYCCEKMRNRQAPSQITEQTATTRSNHEGLVRTKEETNPVYIIAEVNTEEFAPDLRDAGVNGVINRNKIVDGLIVQSILNPGVSKLINNILSFSEDTNEFYTVDLLDPDNGHLRNLTFDELILPLRKQNILLIAIKVIYRDLAGKEIVDEDEISQLLKAEGLNRQIITNPITEAEINRKTDGDDKLITLAASAEKLDTGLKKIMEEKITASV